MKVVAAILIYKKKILALQRAHSKKTYTSLKYEFPGGKVKKNEPLLKALKRELKEELSIKVCNPTLYFNTSYKYPDFEVIINFFICNIKQLNIKLNVHIGYKLLDTNNLRQVDWLDADYEVIDYIERNGLF